MKSNWKIDTFKNAFYKSKSTILALLLGLTMGFAGGQAVHSSTQTCHEKIEVSKIPVHVMGDSFFSDFLFGDMPVSLERDLRFGSFAGSPKVDIFDTAGTVKITADVPGIDEKDLEVSVSDNLLTIKGEKKQEVADKGARRQERFCGTFQRTFTIPSGVQSDKADATLKNGVLTIVIPKSQIAQKESKKLTIKTQ